MIIIGCAALAVIGTGGVFVVSRNYDETSRTERAVGRHILLPQSERPTLGTVADPSKLKANPLYIKAVSGDKVLFYKQANRAYVYRPSSDKIVAVGVLAVDAAALNRLGLKIVVVTRATLEQQTKEVMGRLRERLPNSLVSQRTVTKQYPQTIVLEPTGKRQPLAEQVADALTLPPGKLPLGEAGDEADIVIIVGDTLE